MMYEQHLPEIGEKDFVQHLQALQALTLIEHSVFNLLQVAAMLYQSVPNPEQDVNLNIMVAIERLKRVGQTRHEMAGADANALQSLISEMANRLFDNLDVSCSFEEGKNTVSVVMDGQSTIVAGHDSLPGLLAQLEGLQKNKDRVAAIIRENKRKEG